MPNLHAIAVEIEAIDQIRRYGTSLLTVADALETVVRIIESGQVPSQEILDDANKAAAEAQREGTGMRGLASTVTAVAVLLRGRPGKA